MTCEESCGTRDHSAWRRAGFRGTSEQPCGADTEVIEETSARLFTVEHGRRLRNNMHELKIEKLRLYLNKKSPRGQSSSRAEDTREFVLSLSLEVFK